MSKYKPTYNPFVILVLFLFLGCTEEYIPSTETFEKLMVVETSITDEFKNQKIKLTSTYTFEDSIVPAIINASVFIKDNLGQEYSFQYKEEDTAYISIEKFKAEPNQSYQLFIETANGDKFESTQETLPPASNMDLQLSTETIDEKFGAVFKTNSINPTNNTTYYRYEYQEAYKVIAPFWGPYNAIYVNEVPHTPNYCFVSYRDREENNRVCYTVKESKEIIITNTRNQSTPDLENFLIKFIPQSGWRSAHRYALKVDQYVINRDAYAYYKNLKKISGNSDNDNTLSPTQPGFIEGNISSTDSNKKALGYFELASHSSERLFFNYDDLYPNQPKPAYYIDCIVEELRDGFPCSYPRGEELERLVSLIVADTKSLYELQQGQGSAPDTYFMVETPCSKCTSISSNEIPDFWYE